MTSICIGPPILKMPPSVLLGPLRDFTEKKMIIKNHESHVQSVLENVKEDFFFLFFLCSSLSSSAYVIYKFLVIMLHEVTLS